LDRLVRALSNLRLREGKQMKKLATTSMKRKRLQARRTKKAMREREKAANHRKKLQEAVFREKKQQPETAPVEVQP
jgi:hypothetical protein